ncbi:MAG: DUF2789 domain-containing protein [Pseudomonadales bacterium]|nr:DUF2789 domain-containing protein [Gammaproteobacteria bacterium]NNL57312.1 DUF2789 domain-containing protein [Pseudomonadales bacterium]
MIEEPITINDLFKQLGLPDSDEAIAEFIAARKPLAEDIPVQSAPFWNTSQSQLLEESLQDDSDWAVVVDDLSARLRA